MIVLLLWPDISEVTVLGVGLKRQVKDAQATANEASRQVSSLSLTVHNQQVKLESLAIASASSMANVTNQNYIGMDNAWTEENSKLLSLIYKMLEPNAVSAPTEDLSEIPVDSLKMRMLKQYESLASMLNLYQMRPRYDQDHLPEREYVARQIFIERNRSALDSVRQLRNSIAHAQKVDKEDIIEGIGILEKLLPESRQWLEENESDSANPE